MMTENQKKKRKRKNKRKITFDEELVTKDKAIILSQSIADKKPISNDVPRKKKRKHQEEVTQDASVSSTTNSEVEPQKKKSKKRNVNKYVEEAKYEEAIDELDPTKPDMKKVESIREKKRKKHKELLETKRVKSEENMQKQCLNYLSKWKHAHNTWKFEKLKQIWLQKHIFDEVKIPSDFWNVALDYFISSKGKTRNTLLQESLKIVEDVDSKDKIPEELKLKYNRAREIVQNLQE